MTDTTVAPWKANEDGDNSVARPPLRLVDNADGSFSLAVHVPEMEQLQQQNVTLIEQNNTFIANQTLIIEALSGLNATLIQVRDDAPGKSDEKAAKVRVLSGIL